MLMSFRIDHGIFARQMVSGSRLAEACSEPHLPVIRHPHYARTPETQIGRIPARLCASARAEACNGGCRQASRLIRGRSRTKNWDHPKTRMS